MTAEGAQSGAPYSVREHPLSGQEKAGGRGDDRGSGGCLRERRYR